MHKIKIIKIKSNKEKMKERILLFIGFIMEILLIILFLLIIVNIYNVGYIVFTSKNIILILNMLGLIFLLSFIPILFFKTGFYRIILTYKTEWILSPSGILRVDYGYNNKIIGKTDIPRSSIVKIEYDIRNSEIYIITKKNKEIIGYTIRKDDYDDRDFEEFLKYITIYYIKKIIQKQQGLYRRD